MISLRAAITAQISTREHPSGADDRTAHASEAGQCARRIWYRKGLTPRSNPDPLSRLIAFQIGTDLHVQVQEALKRKHPDTQTEVFWEKGPVSGHADALYTTPAGVRFVAEIKTASPFAWGYMKTPKAEHRLQASVNALALGATMIHIIYLNIAAKAGDDPIREFGEHLDYEAATREMDRLAAIACTERLHAREYEGRLIDPADEGYPCTYCPYVDQCLADGA